MKRLLTLLTSLALAACSSGKEPLALGDPPPRLKATNQSGERVDLAEALGSGLALVYFYPKADTPGCTKQACSLRDAYATLREAGVAIYGVSTDGVAAQRKFKEKYNLPFDLLADTDARIAKSFGVPVRANFTARQAYLFHDGKLVWRDLSASTEDQARDVLNVLAKIPGKDTPA